MGQQKYDWKAIAKNPKFVELSRKKTAFLLGWWVFSTVYYFCLPLGAAYAPGIFKIKVVGPINLGYLFALSQFFVSWGIAGYYAYVANKDFDRLNRELIDEIAK
ncbi:DUF485 domain-containing protein [Geomesophilobacter sediminis]|uniref:DUF485 domain-containing protein n=1 Tax=Geomesophilobacter sediminis TaxID=2798584 RepID=A0A8J7LYR8_9BACT|nr:DUF485 domain-containing protein [Geomesophilobacter sediminis]MBJ6725461.1 DUF485 domain-containing protein [Geomesophilobacter sediminis]